MNGACRAWRLALLLACSAAASPALAEEADPITDEQKQGYRRAIDAFDEKNCKVAVPIFERLSHELPPGRGWTIPYNLGVCYQRRGDVSRAAEQLERFLREYRRQDPSRHPELAEKERDAHARMGQIRAAFGEVQVKLPTRGSASVAVDRQAPRPVPFTVFLQPGRHLFEVHNDGQRHTVTLSIERGKLYPLIPDPAPPRTVAPPAAPPPRVPQPNPGPDDSNPGNDHSFPTAVVVVGVALTAASAVASLLLRQRAQDRRSEAAGLGAGHGDYPAARDEYRQAREAYNLSLIVPPVLAAATTGIVVVHFATAPPDSEARSKGPSLAAGLAVNGTF